MATNVSSGELIPESINQWKKTARINGVLGTINQLGSHVKVDSASKFQFKHFLGLRVIYKFEKKTLGRSALPTEIIKQFPIPPRIALKKTSYWNKYLKEIEAFARSQDGVTASYIPESLGPLVNVWLYQKHILLGDDTYADMSKVSEVTPVAGRLRSQQQKLRALNLTTPTPASKLQGLSQTMKNVSLSDREAEEGFEELSDEDLDEEAPDDGSESDSDPNTPNKSHDDAFITPGRNEAGQLIKDEQTVNVFIISFLSAITATTVPFHTRWLAERNAMVYKKRVRFVARTDGHLRGRAGQTHSLIEVKPRVRKAADVSICMQESAQMTAWLTQNNEESHDPYKECRIFLLSQDKDEIFLTFPSWGKAYGKNTPNTADEADIDKLTKDDFLWMEEYGPFRLDSSDDVAQVANFLHGYTIHVSGILDASKK